MKYVDRIKQMPAMIDRYQYAMKRCYKTRLVKGGRKFWFKDGTAYTISYQMEHYDKFDLFQGATDYFDEN